VAKIISGGNVVSGHRWRRRHKAGINGWRNVAWHQSIVMAGEAENQRENENIEEIEEKS
jgi:hypothetical protein